MYKDPDEYEADYIDIPSYNDGYNPSSYQTNPSKAKKTYRSHKTTGFKNLIICGALLLSLSLGFGGGLLAGLITDNNSTPVATTANSGYTAITSGGKSLSVSEVAATAANSIVEITTSSAATDNYFGQFISEGAGSGVIFSTDGYIITNNHVINDANSITVRLNNGTEYDAELVGTDPQTDIAVIKIKAADLQPAVCGNSDKLIVGELAVAIGNPLGELGGTVTDGIISALNREININGQNMTLLQTNAAINPGNSGGGLFNSKGEFIGIVNAKSYGSDIEGLGFAIPVNLAKSVAEELINHGYVPGRPVMGVQLVDITTPQKAMMYRVSELGVYVYSVAEDGGAAKASMKAGDLLISINGDLAVSSADVTTALNKCKAGDTIKVVIQRSGVQKTLNVKLMEYKPL